MNWYYALDGQQKGPVSDSQLEELLRSGSINPATLVWRTGMTEWQPLTMARAGTPPAAGAAPGIVCAACGRSFPPDNIIQLNNSWVCAQCKPEFLQRLAEGAALPAAGRLWRLKRQVVTFSGTTFPDRCVKCNAPANGFRLKRVLYWQHPAYYLLFLVNLLVLLIVILIVRKKAIVQIGLCERHRARRKRGVIVGWSSLAGCVILIVSAVVLSSGRAAVAGGLLLLAGGIYAAVAANTVTAAKITKENVWITGCKEDFLAVLPEWRGS